MSGTYRQRLEFSLTHWLIAAAATPAYATVLYYSYKLKVSPLFAYQGLTYERPDLGTYIPMLACATLVAMALPIRIKHTSDFILWLFFIVAAAPAMLIPQYMGRLPDGEATKLGLAVAGCTLFIRALTAARPTPRRAGRVVVSPTTLWLGLGLIAGVTYLGVLLTFGLSLRWLELTEVYDVRSEFSTTFATVPALGYLIPVVHNVINPVFMARGVYSGRWRFFFAGALGQYLLYATTGHKSILFSVLAIAVIARLFRNDLRMRGTRLLTVTAIGALATLALDALLDSYLWTSLFVRRFMIVPGALVAGYVSVFHDKPKYGFPNVLPGVEAPYATAPSRMVGALFVGDPNTNANASLFGDGFAQAGYLGIFIEGLFLVLLLWAADAATKGLAKPVAALVFFMPTIALVSGSVFTVAVTHGFVFAIVVSACLPRTGWGRPAPGRLAPRGRERAGQHH